MSRANVTGFVDFGRALHAAWLGSSPRMETTPIQDGDSVMKDFFSSPERLSGS